MKQPFAKIAKVLTRKKTKLYVMNVTEMRNKLLLGLVLLLISIGAMFTGIGIVGYNVLIAEHNEPTQTIIGFTITMIGLVSALIISQKLTVLNEQIQ